MAKIHHGWHTYLKKTSFFSNLDGPIIGQFTPNLIQGIGENIFQIELTHSQANLIGMSANVAGDPRRVQKVEGFTFELIYGYAVNAKCPFTEENRRCNTGVDMLP